MKRALFQLAITRRKLLLWIQTACNSVLPWIDEENASYIL